MKQLKFKAWVKTDANDHKTWHVNDLIAFTAFLNRHHPNWRYFNLYAIWPTTERQLASFTKTSPPLYKNPKNYLNYK